MGERSESTIPKRVDGTNADDPSADRLAAYPDAGELGSPQTAHELVGQEPEPTASGPQPAGKDAELLQIGGSGDRLGGPHATDKPGGAGLPGPGRTVAAGREPAVEGDGDDASLVDRLDR